MFRPLLAVLLLLLATPLARADNGRLEINQACATGAGCFAGDNPGLPVSISTSGSYVLTSDIDQPTANQAVIVVSADAVDLDLNGFTVGYCLNAFCIRSTAGAGISGSGADDVRVRNGRVVSMGSHGIALGERARVTDVHATNNGFDGIRLDGDSLVDRCTVANNGDNGVHLQGGNSMLLNSIVVDNADWGLIGLNITLYRGNVFRGNNDGLEQQVSQANDGGGNYCGSSSACP